LQDSFYSIALKSLISVSTMILLGLILAYHALEVQVRLIAASARSFVLMCRLQSKTQANQSTIRVAWMPERRCPAALKWIIP
jgi:hypothetical protein